MRSQERPRSPNIDEVLERLDLTDDERAAVEDDRDALAKLIDNLTDVPTPAGPTPRDLGTGTFIPLTTLLETLPQQRASGSESNKA